MNVRLGRQSKRSLDERIALAVTDVSAGGCNQVACILGVGVGIAGARAPAGAKGAGKFDLVVVVAE